MVSDSTLEFIATHKPKFAHLHRMMRFGKPEQVHGLIDLCAVITDHFGDGLIMMAEIGCFAGESTLIFYTHLPLISISCVDRWGIRYYKNNQMEEAEKCFDSSARLCHRLEKRKMDSTLFFRSETPRNLGEDGPFDCVYIDGNHSFESVSSDIKGAIKITSHNSIICGHDYGMTGVKKAVTEHLGEPDRIFCDGSWLKYKINLKTK